MLPHELAQKIGRQTRMLPPLAPRQADATRLQCMEVWGGNSVVETALEVAGLDVWISCSPYQGAEHGGDIHYISTCGSGRVSRFVVADVSGHGAKVSNLAERLKLLMRKHVNLLNMAQFAKELNREFSSLGQEGRFATALLATYFAPTDHLILCNAGHPRPLWYRAGFNTWQYLDEANPERVESVERADNLPLGIIEPTEYVQFAVKLDPGDRVVLYTDSLMEANAPVTGQQLGEAGLLRLAGGLTQTDAPLLGQQLIEAIQGWRGGQPAEDDQTIVVLAHNAGDPPPMTKAWGTITALAHLVGLIDY